MRALRRRASKPKRAYLVCQHVKSAEDVLHFKPFDDAEGLERSARWGEVTCRQTLGQDRIEDCVLVDERDVRKILPQFFPC